MDDLSLEHPDLDHWLDEGGSELPQPLRAHLDRCPRCAAELEALQHVRELAHALPREIMPPRDLWPYVASRISQPSIAARPGQASAAEADGRGARGFSRGWLAAAAVVLVALSSTATAYLLRQEGGADVPVAAVEEPATGSSRGLAAFAASDEEYRDAVRSLEAELEARRERLSPETVATVEANLTIIDGAIAEATRALAVDPSSTDLPLLLAGVYRQKIELLRRAVELSRTS